MTGTMYALAALIVCFHCRRELTDPESIARGVGPDCFAKYGLTRKKAEAPAENALAFPFARSGSLYANEKRVGRR